MQMNDCALLQERVKHIGSRNLTNRCSPLETIKAIQRKDLRTFVKCSSMLSETF